MRAYPSKVSGRRRPVGIGGFPPLKEGVRAASAVFFCPSTTLRTSTSTVMVPHSVYRPLWPLIFFIPWLFMGGAYLGEWVLHRSLRSIRIPSVRSRHRTALFAGILLILALCFLLIFAPLAVADPVLEGQAPCLVTTREQARSMADSLFEQGNYQSAGICYQAAEEYALANRAFAKALEPQSKLTARQLSEQRDQAKLLLHRVQLAFRAEH